MIDDFLESFYGIWKALGRSKCLLSSDGLVKALKLVSI